MKCWCCNKEAYERYSPDPDIEGIGYCEEHKWDVMVAVFSLMNGDSKPIEKIKAK